MESLKNDDSKKIIPHSTKKPNPLTKARKDYQEKKKNEDEIKKNKEEEKIRNQQLKQEKERRRDQSRKKLLQRNKRGQPVLKNHINHLLHKIKSEMN
ncbi:hypothetical protein O9G_002017 [Rozella allomycis CSF55]|uniref:rRNA-processing protein FYV7 n=1 Tax=Rozella allomycis (strain CSF55) TaxID=988480 RepID=A0A075B1P0_ROZAC|nr:hypothetical protein O9G_002017 [Rozella allomycis CSF55]|eukprot:EPZ34886.1 hypothetical protein O9G_002017 [Rozella allomycis CSF55]